MLFLLKFYSAVSLYRRERLRSCFHILLSSFLQEIRELIVEQYIIFDGSFRTETVAFLADTFVGAQ